MGLLSKERAVAFTRERGKEREKEKELERGRERETFLHLRYVKTQQIFLGIPNPSERSWEFFFASLVVTYIMSLITYSYVERPFFGFKKIRSS